VFQRRGLIDKSDNLVIAGGATALQVEEVSPTARDILFPNKFAFGCASEALASIEEGTFTHKVIPEKRKIELRKIAVIDCETLRLGGGWEFLSGNGRWLIRRRPIS